MIVIWGLASGFEQFMKPSCSKRKGNASNRICFLYRFISCSRFEALARVEKAIDETDKQHLDFSRQIEVQPFLCENSSPFLLSFPCFHLRPRKSHLGYHAVRVESCQLTPPPA